MKKLALIVYSLLSWLIILVLFMSFSVLFVLESPSSFFKLVKSPLQELGISYDEIEGSLLSGFVLHNINYQDKVQAKSMSVKVDLQHLEERVLLIDNLVLDEVQIEETFLTRLLENNSTNEETNEQNTTLPFDRVMVTHLDLSLLDTSYDAYHVNYAKLTVNNLETDMKKEHKGDVKFMLDSNVSQVNMEASLENEQFKLLGTIEGEQMFIQPFLTEHNASLLTNPKVKIEAAGNLNNIDFVVDTKALDLKYQHYKIHTKLLTSSGNYDLTNKHLKMKLKSEIESDIANLETRSDVKVTIDDVNNSLEFDVYAKLNPKESLLDEKLLIKQLKAQNIEINSLPLFTVMAKGNMEKVDFQTNIKGFNATQNKLSLSLKELDLKGNTKPLHGDTVTDIVLNFDSSAGKGVLKANTKLNFNKLEETLYVDLTSSLSVYDSYLNPLLKESNINLEGDTLVHLKSSGNLENIKINLDGTSTINAESIRSKVNLKTEEISLNLKKELISGGLFLNSNANNLALNLETQFSGNYMKPKNLVSSSRVNISKFNAFAINLTELLPLDLDVNTDVVGGRVNLASQKLQLSANTRDYDHIDFSINSDKIYPDKIVEVPSELKDKFIEVDLKGNATLSTQYFSLQGVLAANNNFKANVNAYSQVNGLDVNVFTKHFHLNAKGDLKKKSIRSTVKIGSLKKVQKEFQSLYPFNTVEVDGALHLDTKLNGEKVSGTLSSSKLKLEGFNIEQLAINADYSGTLLSINKLNFKTTGFKEEGLNQDFYLNKKGFVSLGEEKEVSLDMHPKISLKGKGNDTNLKATFQIEDLFLGYQDYGTTRVSCDIDYVQTANKKKVIGGVFLDKMKISYESKFLDPSSDNDVVIVRKKDKNKKVADDSFLNDTFIDLTVYSSAANYKTRDIDLTLDVNVKANKEFGKGLVMLGKIEKIEGRVEQAPKLFTVVESNIVFQGNKEINPLLDLTVEHELPDVLITINIHGNAKRPKLTFTSEPPLPKKDILSYLLLGVSTAGLGEGKGSLGREAQLFIMNQAARDLAYEVELDRVFVKDDGTGEGYAVQVGKKIEEDTMFVIENSTEGNSFILEYDVNKNIKVEVGQHQKTVPSQSIDIYFRKKFK